MNAIEYRDAHATASIAAFVGFAECYQEAFGGPPYFETYTVGQVHRDVWAPHSEKGLVILACDADAVIGFGCALPFGSSPDDVQEFLRTKESEGSLAIDLELAWYMSELGVTEKYRGRKIGYMLIKERLEGILRKGGAHYVARTAAQASNSLHMYENLGSTILPGTQDISTSEQVQVNLSQSSERIYFFGSCAEALARITTILSV